jgi:hypothetical protein
LAPCAARRVLCAARYACWSAALTVPPVLGGDAVAEGAMDVALEVTAGAELSEAEVVVGRGRREVLRIAPLVLAADEMDTVGRTVEDGSDSGIEAEGVSTGVSTGVAEDSTDELGEMFVSGGEQSWCPLNSRWLRGRD